MIISIHMPKAAGSSFLSALRDVYGTGLKSDYDDMVALQAYFAGEPSDNVCRPAPMTTLEHIACVHGHFAAPKYGAFALGPENLFITWLREPAQRLHSHYWFWRRTFDPNSAGPLWQQFMRENWSLERFCLGYEYRNVYHKYLCGFPVARIDFTGIVERYTEDLAKLGREVTV